MKFIYKIYITLFVYFSKQGEGAWIRTMLVFLGVSFFFSILGLAMVGLNKQLIDLFSLKSGNEYLDKAPFFSLMFFLYWKLFSYLFYVKMAISKEDGKSPYYEYTPTKRDIILVWAVFFSIFSSPLIYLGITTLIFN